MSNKETLASFTGGNDVKFFIARTDGIYTVSVRKGKKMPYDWTEYQCIADEDLGKTVLSTLVLAWSRKYDLGNLLTSIQGFIELPVNTGTEVFVNRKQARIWLTESGQMRVLWKDDEDFEAFPLNDAYGEPIVLAPL